MLTRDTLTGEFIILGSSEEKPCFKSGKIPMKKEVLRMLKFAYHMDLYTTTPDQGDPSEPGYGVQKIQDWILDNFYVPEAFSKASESSIRAKYIIMGGKIFPEMINDKSYFVKCAIASRGVAHDVLSEDEDEDVRISCIVAGYMHEKFKKDPDSCVRVAFVERCPIEMIDEFKNDPSDSVRVAFVERCPIEMIDESLMSDESCFVQSAIKRRLSKKQEEL